MGIQLEADAIDTIVTDAVLGLWLTVETRVVEAVLGFWLTVVVAAVVWVTWMVVADEAGAEGELAGTEAELAGELAGAEELALDAEEAGTEEDATGLLLEGTATGTLQLPLAMLSMT